MIVVYVCTADGPSVRLLGENSAANSQQRKQTNRRMSKNKNNKKTNGINLLMPMRYDCDGFVNVNESSKIELCVCS